MAPAGAISRRTVVKTIGCAAAATCGFAAGAKAEDYVPYPQNKITKAAAHYQDKPEGNELCGGCPYFIVPNGCVTVEGEVSPSGWCPMFTTFSPLDRGAHT